ncbi:MAG TPA: sugar phosphate isomerase/epimerase, partial [Capillimicrobium sp.]
MDRDQHLDGRLGLNVPRSTWPTPPLLKSYEAAGFAWVQIHTPPVAMLARRELARRHARAMRAALEPTGLRVVLHAPDDLSAGADLHDRAFGGLLDYAGETGAQRIVYHGLNFRTAADATSARALGERIALEEASLRRFAPAAARIGATICVENLAPVYPAPPLAPRVCHDPLEVAALVVRVDELAVAMLLDLGHAYITGAARRTALSDTIDAVGDAVALFHVHDNLGARRHDVQAPGVDPLRLDLHLPPGAGSIAWARTAPALRQHDAPLML